MLGRSGYRALPLGDFDRFQQSSFGFLGSQKGCLSPEPGGVGPGAGEWPPSTADPGEIGWQPWAQTLCLSGVSRCTSELAFLPLPWPHQFPGVLAAADHLPHFWLVCPEDEETEAQTCPKSYWEPISGRNKSSQTPKFGGLNTGFKIVPTYERMIVFRLGRIRTPQGPGVVLLLPFIDSFQRVDLRTRAFSVPPCKLASKDGAVLSVGADVQFRIWDPVLSVMTVKDLNTATRMTAQNAMTKALLKRPLREIQMEKPKISDQLLLEINDVTRAWGLEVDRVELAVEAVLQLPQDSPAGPSLDSTLQQLALHFLGGGMASVAGGAPLPEPADTLDMVNEVEPSAPHGGAGSSPKQPVAEGLLTALKPFLSEALVSQVGACYQFNVVLPSGTQSIYFLDLTTGQGRVGHGEPDAIPDVVVEMAEEDLQALLCRELRPLGAYMSGRLKVKGDLAVAMKLEAVLRALK
ncbi:stomatin-like protein 1 isoform X1 [Phocoena sinus]|uniref:stomatin-like protein 1 isoform X1 n=2 Tax=Phocoena sinus TaxID=42100 RepID=UPI0013C41CBD|nr:stomatin-like protein 1 isoform X1 [Phocoena sinus]